MTAADVQPAPEIHDGSATARGPRTRDEGAAGRARFTFDWSARSRRVLAFALVAAVVGCAVLLLLHYSTPPIDVALYCGYVLGWVLLPGYVVQRSLLGARGAWAEDALIALGTGVILNLAAWAIASLMGMQAWLALWPLAVLALLVPRRTRRRIFTRPTAQWHPVAQAATALAMVASLVHIARTYFAVWALPPTSRAFYQDTLWHMGLAAEATRSFPLHIPQAMTAGLLRYQWFADADLGATSLISHINIPTLILRLWPALMVVLAIGLTAVLGTVLSRHSSVGGLAALVTAATTVLTPWLAQLDFNDAFRPISPTQLYSFTPLLMAAIVLVYFLRREGNTAGAATLGLLALVACAGAKPSVMPMLLAGLVAGAIAAMILRTGWTRFAIAAAAAGVITVAGMALVAGGDAGVRPKFFHLLTLSPFVAGSLSNGPFGGDGILVQGMFSGATMSLAVIGAAMLVAIRPLLGVAPLFSRALRRDPLAWWMSGMCGSAVAAGLVLGHPGYSELYFILTATPLGAIMGAWWLRVSIRSRADAIVAGVAVAAGLALGGLSALLATQLDGADQITFARTIVLGGLIVATVTIAVTIAYAILRRRTGVRASLAVPLLGMVFGVLLVSLVPTALMPGTPPPSSASSADESSAAIWISDHVAPDAILAVNDQCLDTESDTCDARNWWASGLGGRRILLEGWGYTPQSSSVNPESKIHPVFDESLWRFNQSLFEAPTASALDRARGMGVDYLVATAGSTPVASSLADHAKIVYQNPTITIYRIGASTASDGTSK